MLKRLFVHQVFFNLNSSKHFTVPSILFFPFKFTFLNILRVFSFQNDENLNILHHPAHFKGPILFSFNAKNFFGKKKASIKAETGDWSDKFSLDVAGSSGVVNCKTDDTVYNVSMKINTQPLVKIYTTKLN